MYDMDLLVKINSQEIFAIFFLTVYINLPDESEREILKKKQKESVLKGKLKKKTFNFSKMELKQR